jgi:hypothetical protein
MFSVLNVVINSTISAAQRNTLQQCRVVVASKTKSIDANAIVSQSKSQLLLVKGREFVHNKNRIFITTVSIRIFVRLVPSFQLLY